MGTTGWKKLLDDDKDDIHIEWQKIPNSFMAMRTKGKANFSAYDIWKTIAHTDSRVKWDKSCAKSHGITKRGVNGGTIYY